MQKETQPAYLSARHYQIRPNTLVDNAPIGNTPVENTPIENTGVDVGSFAPMNPDNTEADLQSYDWEHQVAEMFHDASSKLAKGEVGCGDGIIPTPHMPFLRQILLDSITCAPPQQ